MSSQRISTLLADAGLIAIDEHSTAACMIHDVSATGLSLTLLDALDVPASFVLFVGGEVRVCRVVRRGDETIEAAFTDLACADHAARMPVRAARAGSLPTIRRFANERPLRHAA